MLKRNLSLILLFIFTHNKSQEGLVPTLKLVNDISSKYVNIARNRGTNTIIEAKDSVWMNGQLSDLKYHLNNYNYCKKARLASFIVAGIFAIPYLIYIYKSLSAASNDANNKYVEVYKEQLDKYSKSNAEKEEGGQRDVAIPSREAFVRAYIMRFVINSILDFLSNPFCVRQSYKAIIVALIFQKYYSMYIKASSEKFRNINNIFDHVLPLYESKLDLLNSRNPLSVENTYYRLQNINSDIKAAMENYQRKIELRSIVKTLVKSLTELM